METVKQNLINPSVVETYARAICEGKTQSEAYILSHPKTNGTGVNLRVMANRFHKRDDVQEAISKLKEEGRERWSEFRDELIGMLTEEIRTCYRDNSTLSPVMKQVDTVTRILGMDKQTVEVKADVRQAMDVESVAEKLNFLIAHAKSSAKADDGD